MVGLENISKVSVSGDELAYFHRRGPGPTVLLIHGITTYRFIWRKLIPLFPDQMNIVAMDLLGCGDSDKPLHADLSLKSHAARIIDLINQLSLKDIHLVGHDVGGGIAQIMAVSAPQHFKTLSLLNSVGYDYWPVQPIIAMRTPILRQFALASLDMGMLKLIVRRGLYNEAALTRELLDLFQYPLKNSAGRRSFLQFAKCLDNNDLMSIKDDLERMKLPTLILRGGHDVYLSLSISERLRDGIQNSELIVFREAGHFFQEEIPHELVGALKEHIGQ